MLGPMSAMQGASTGAANPFPTVAVGSDNTAHSAQTVSANGSPIVVLEAATQPTRTDESLLQRLEDTRGAKIISGKSKVSLGDVLQLSFWLDTIKELVLVGLGIVPRMLAALLFLIVSWGAYRFLRRVILGSMTKAHVDVSFGDMLGAVLKWSVMGFGVVIACNQIGIQITALLAGVSIIGLAVGFAAQETLANFIAGIVIFWDKPFKVGDWVEVHEQYGQVLRITFRSTRILALNGEVIVFPNTQMLSQKVANHSTHPLTGVAVPIGISYKESIDNARQVLLATLDGDDRICLDPAPAVAVVRCADSSVNLELRFWIRDEAQQKKIWSDYLEKAKKALDMAGIQIPYPHMQLILEESPSLQRLTDKRELRAAG